MLHSYVQGGWCVVIQKDTDTLIINPTIDNFQQKQRLDEYVNAQTIYTYGDDCIDDSTVACFSLECMDSCLLIMVDDVRIVYHCRDFPIDKWLVALDPDLLFVDMDIGFDNACDIASIVKAKTVVPINVKSTDDPIGFCREVMLHHRWVPKYLKPGQYIVHS